LPELIETGSDIVISANYDAKVIRADTVTLTVVDRIGMSVMLTRTDTEHLPH